MDNNTLGLNQTFPIYNADGTAFHDLVIHQASVESTVMSLGDKISGDVFYKDNTLVVTMGEYIVYDGVKYVLVNPPTIVRNGMVSDNNGTNGMTKYSFVFYHPMYMLGNFPFSDIAVTNDETKYLSQSKTFSWIGNLFDFIAKLNKNLEQTDWYVAHNIARYDDNDDETSEWQKATKLSDVLSFDKQFISDALKTAYDTWEIPFVIIQEENAEHKHFGIIFGLPDQEILDSNENPFVFRFGKGVGLKNNSRTPRNNKIVTRIVGYGSERNIPYGYPQIPWYGNPDWSYTINNDPNEPNSLPIYDGILGGQNVRLIKHPFTRTTLMPSLYCEFLFDKVSPYLPDGTSNTYYDPTIDLIDYLDADNSYPNPIIEDAPSVEIHQFEDIYPELGEAYIVDAVPYDQDGEYYEYDDWFDYLIGRIEGMQERGVEGWQLALIQTMYDVTCPLEPQDVEAYPDVIIEAGHWEWETGQTTATLDVTIKGNFVYVKLVSSWYNEEHRVVQLHADPTPVWNDTMNDNGEYIQSYFEITLPQLSFDLYACASITEEMKINMRGGACKGCTFPVYVDWEEYKANFYTDDGKFDPVIHTTQGDGHVRDGSKFPDSRQGQITILVKKEIETFGTLMPNVYQQPTNGDAFVILGISLPQSYVEDAQMRLDEAMQEYMLENNVHYYDYPLTFDEHFLATHTDILAQMHNNSIVRFQYAGIEMALYIKQMNIKFGQKVLPEYEITLTDDVEIVLNKIGKVTDDVSRMRVQVSELQKYYSENLIEAINSKLSKTIDDVCQGRITFQQGLDAIGSVIFHDKLQSPQFVEGLYRGSGWRVDNLGNAEFESLRIRSFLEVVELLVNRMQAQEGDTIFTDNDQIEKVDTITQSGHNYYILTLKEKYQGYVTTQTEGNVIKGIINTLAAKEAGISTYSDNVLYFTSWMHVEETHTTPNSTLGVNQIRVSLYGDNDVPSGKNYLPCELMTIARWGNTLNPDASGISADEKARRKRLRSTFYISTSEGRIAKLIDVNAPKLVETNYGTTLGELPDFVKAYSSVAPRLQEGRDYLYAQGVVVEDFIKITRQGNPIYEYVDCGEWIDGSSGTPSVGHGIYLFQEFNSVTGQYETHDVWHNNAKWRAKMHQPVTIGGVSTYYEPSDTNTAYWEKLEEALQGTSYDVVWTDAFGVITNIPCDANGIAKYRTGGGYDTWLTTTLYKRVGNNTPTLLNVASIVLHAYNASGNEVSGFPHTANNTSSISLNNYESGAISQFRYVVEFKDAQNNVIATSSIARNLDGTNADVWTIGQDGYWYKNGVRQSTKAEGEDGTGIELQGSVDVVLNSDISGSQTSLEGVTGMQVGDCYMVTANGWLYFYDGTTPASAGSGDIPKNPQGWKPVGKIKGEPGQDGDTYYYHIAYADDISIEGGVVTATGFTTTKVKDAYAWMGICTDTNNADPQTPQSYEWNFVQGDSITKQSESYRYATNTTGVRPSASSSNWVTTKPTLQQGYWLFTETTIHWSDGSTTVLYTDERNPNDGVTGQSIIVDGATVMKYCVNTSNTTHPADNSSEWKDLSQVTQEQGKWLWSQATTYYRKANSTAGSHDAGSSINYNVNYIAEDGNPGRGITSVTEYYKASANATGETAPSDDSGWNTNPNNAMQGWNQTNKYLWNYEKVTYSSGTTVERSTPTVIAIWTKDGATGKGVDSITNYYQVKATKPSLPANIDTTNPTLTGWSTSPSNPPQGQYLWNFERIVWLNSDGTYSYTHTDVHSAGYTGTDGASITKTSEVITYQVTDSGTTTPSGTWYASKQAAIEAYNVAHSISGTTWQPNTFMWTRTIITWSDTTTTTLYSTDRNPNDGQRGKTGRWIYYGKEFDETNTTDTFVVSDVQIPYFKTGNNSYHAFDYGVNGTYTMAQMYAIQPNFNNAPWEIMTNDFEYLISKAFFSEYANLGSFVINGDWMMSLQPTADSPSNDYTHFDPDCPNSANISNNNFIPMYAVNGRTGATYQNDGHFIGNIKSSNAEIIGKVTANEGKIGDFNIDGQGLWKGTYNPDTWVTDPQNFAFLNTSSFRICKKTSYAGHIISQTSACFGLDSDPDYYDPQLEDGSFDSAMYLYRRKTEGDSLTEFYRPAAKIISDNAGTINVALRLGGALQIHGGGVIEQGQYLEYDDANNRLGLNLTYGTTFVLKNTNSSQNVWFQLPTLTQVLTQLGMASGTKFAIPITISAHLNSREFYLISPPNVYMRYNDGSIINKTTISGEGQCSRLTFEKCDTARLILISDGSTYYVQSAGRFT